MASLSPDLQRLIDNNEHYQDGFQAPPSIADFRSMLQKNPTLEVPRICIITCCDSRVVPEYIFGLSLGDAIVMRTAGGSVRPAVPALLAIDGMMAIKDIVIMRHTDCGTAYWTDSSVREVLKERCGPAWEVEKNEVEKMDFCGSNGDRGDEHLLKQDVEWLRNSSLIRDQFKARIVGMIYQTDTGKASVVC